jgi:hypothetical protein
VRSRPRAACSRFADLLAGLLYLFTPWTAINLVDFYVVRKGHYSIREIFNPNGMYGRWNWRGLLAYGAGFAAMIPFFSTEVWRGPVARALGGADIAMLIGLPVSAGVYLWAYRALCGRGAPCGRGGCRPRTGVPAAALSWAGAHMPRSSTTTSVAMRSPSSRAVWSRARL